MCVCVCVCVRVCVRACVRVCECARTEYPPDPNLEYLTLTLRRAPTTSILSRDWPLVQESPNPNPTPALTSTPTLTCTDLEHFESELAVGAREPKHHPHEVKQTQLATNNTRGRVFSIVIG